MANNENHNITVEEEHIELLKKHEELQNEHLALMKKHGELQDKQLALMKKHGELQDKHLALLNEYHDLQNKYGEFLQKEIAKHEKKESVFQRMCNNLHDRYTLIYSILNHSKK